MSIFPPGWDGLPNPKCIIISSITVAAYFLLPPSRPIRSLSIAIAVMLAIVTYILLAWYDHWFECRKDRLKYYPNLWISRMSVPFKPDISSDGYFG